MYCHKFQHEVFLCGLLITNLLITSPLGNLFITETRPFKNVDRENANKSEK